MGSGAWLPAKQVYDTACRSLDIIVSIWTEERETEIRELMKTGGRRWSWLRFKWVRTPLSGEVAEEVWENSWDTQWLQLVLRDPMESPMYRTAVRLRDLAGQAEEMAPGSTVFVSIKDFRSIRSAFKEMTKETI